MIIIKVMIVIVKVIVVIFIPMHPWRELLTDLLQLISDSVAHRQFWRHQYLLALGIMDLGSLSIASILLEAVIPALTAIEEFTRARRKHTRNAASIHGHPIQRTTRLKYPVDNFMELDLPGQLLSIARLYLAHCGDY
jgi:hypothetical protein